MNQSAVPIAAGRRSRSARASLAAFSLLLLSVVPLQAQPRTAFAHRVHPQAIAANDRGALDVSYPLPGITLLLKSSPAQASTLRRLLQSQQDPASPDYHRWLTPEQYASQFGVRQKDIAALTDWLKSQGFTVTHVARSRTWISFSGSAGQVNQAFHTAMHRYSVDGESHYANATDPSLPANLAGLVIGFRGLNDFRLRPRLHTNMHPDLTLAGAHYLSPDDFATIYDVGPLYKSGIDGTGQSIMVVGQSDIRVSDINSFRNQFNLPAINLQQKAVPGRRDPGVVPGDVDEANLDIEWSGAVARNATIYYVHSDDVWQSVFYAVDQNFAPVLTMSYGACEAMDLVDAPGYQAIVQQANAQGITFLGPAGDAGAADCEANGAPIAQTGLAIDIPAAIPEVTAMGGTEFDEQGGPYWTNANGSNSGSALTYIPEKAWNDVAVSQSLWATGGGASIFFAAPPWQTGPGMPTDGVRHVPDLSLNASLYHDPYVFYSGGTGFVGGTSAAAPAMAGILALLNQYLVSTGAQKQPGLGNINPNIYRLAAASPSVFHNVSNGDNLVPCIAGTPDCKNGAFGYPAGSGYNQVTGWGSVDAANLVRQWTSAPPAGAVIVPSIDSRPVFQQPNPDSQGNQWTFHVTLTEEAGVGATLTDFSIDGVSLSGQIAALFSSAVIPPRGSISAAYGLAAVAVPKTVGFAFSGVDAAGRPWEAQMSVPFTGPQIALTATGIGNAATGGQVYAPGMILSVYGTQLADFVQSAGTVPLPTFLAGFEALINGVPAPLYYVSPTQVNIQIPYETQTGKATLILGNPYQQATYTFQVDSAAPGIFTFADGTLNPSRTASAGQTITIFITGEGLVSPSLATGATPPPGEPVNRLPKPRQPVGVTVGGQPATTTFVGIPSGLVGVTQINFTIPSSVTAGVQQVVVTVGTASSPPATITITQ